MQRTISPIWKMAGKRRKLDGFLAEVDGFEVGVFDSYHSAEVACDDYCARMSLMAARRAA